MHATATRLRLGPELASYIHDASTAMYPRHFSTDNHHRSSARLRGWCTTERADHGADPALRAACYDLQGWNT